MIGGAIPIEAIIFFSTVLLLVGGYLFASYVAGRRQAARKIQTVCNRVHLARVGAIQPSMALRKKKENKNRIPFMQRLLDIMPRTRSLGNELERAGIEMSAQSFVVMCAFLFLLCIVVVKVALGKSILLGGCVGIIFGVWLPLKVVRFRIERQLRKFLKLFPEAIDLIVRGLRSGLPVADSMAMIAHEMNDPIKTIFADVINSMKLGVTLEKALQETAKRLDLTEFNFFTTSIIIQRETGGNLSEILNNLGEVLRKREMMRLKIKALTSEARASAIILGAMPFFVAGGASVMSPGFLTPLIDDPRGNMAAAVAGGLLFLGVWLMRRLAKFEI